MAHTDSVLAKQEYFRAYAEMIATMPAVSKDGVNPFANNARYITLNNLYEETIQHVLSHDFVVVDTVAFNHVSQMYELTSRLVHTVWSYVKASNDELYIMENFISTTFPLFFQSPNKQGGLSYNAQTMGGAMTYGRRYNYCVLLRVVGEDDDDGIAANTAQQGSGVVKAAPATTNFNLPI